MVVSNNAGTVALGSGRCWIRKASVPSWASMVPRSPKAWSGGQGRARARSCRRALWPSGCARLGLALGRSSAPPVLAHTARGGQGETRTIDGREKMLKLALRADVALVGTDSYDEMGTLNISEGRPRLRTRDGEPSGDDGRPGPEVEEVGDLDLEALVTPSV